MMNVWKMFWPLWVRDDCCWKKGVLPSPVLLSAAKDRESPRCRPFAALRVASWAFPT